VVAARDIVFDGSLNSVRSLIRIGQQPFLISLQHPNCELFLAAGAKPADLDLPVSDGTLLKDFFSRTAPLLMFVYQACGDSCWHNEEPRACLILDDPLLRKQYGFLDYGKLLAVMEQEEFATSVAFIPWNYRRSNRTTVELFKRAPDRLSLCVHGCDHTGGEFGERDGEVIRALARIALDRMREHQQLTGLAFDHVMVFPQGSFSSAALPALQAQGYLAAINSSPYPVDSTSLRLHDLLSVTITGLSNFPLFIRRYPNDLESLAFDLFLGKPALVVEHHGYFRGGYEPLAELVRRLRNLEPRLRWTSVGEICSRTCLQRRGEDRKECVRYFTDLFRMKNHSVIRQRYVLMRSHSPSESMPETFLNGKPVRCTREGNEITLSVELDRGESAEVRLERPQKTGGEQTRNRKSSRVSVFARRRLSEFRDNYVDRSAFLSGMACRVRNSLVRKS